MMRCPFGKSKIIFKYFSPFTDENRDMNIHIEHDDIKRQRIQYNSDQLYPNVIIFMNEISFSY